jgi:hypothetical protein
MKLAKKRENEREKACPPETRRAVPAVRTGLAKQMREGEPPADNTNAQRRRKYFYDETLGKLFDVLSEGDGQRRQILVDYYTPSTVDWTDEQFENLRNELEDMERRRRRNIVNCFPKGVPPCLTALQHCELRPERCAAVYELLPGKGPQSQVAEGH